MKNIALLLCGLLHFHIASGAKPFVPVNFWMDPASSSVAYADPVSVVVKVDDFTNIAGMQFSLNWDPAVLQFTGVDNFNLPDLTAGSFGTNLTPIGKLTCAWIDATTNGVTVPSGTALFTLHFTAVGLPGSSSIIQFSNDPTPQLVFDPVPNQVPFTNQTATVNITSCNPSIYGNVSRENGTDVQGTTVDLAGTPAGTQLTNAAGNYTFCNLTTGNNYSVTPSKDGNDSECVTVLDLIKILRHILGVEPLPSPYAIIRGDANGSGTLTTFDVVELRKLILGIITELPNRPSWTFVPADYVFPDPTNPFSQPIPSFSEAAPLTADTQFDFIALKTGDVTDCDEPQGPAFLTVTAPQITANNGDPITVSITTDGLIDVLGLQFSMNWDPNVLQFTGVQSFGLPGMSASNFGTNNAATGSLSVAYTEPNAPGATLPNGGTLFQINFTVIGQSGNTSGLTFVQNPAVFEVVDDDCDAFGLNYVNGSVQVSGPPPPLAVEFSASDIAACGTGAVLDVTVANFVNIAGVQFTMTFDPTKLQFNNTQNYGLPGLTASNFGTTQTGNGILTFAWIDQNTTGVTLPDGTVAFSVNFNVLGTGTSIFDFGSVPTAALAILPDLSSVPIDFDTGSITCTPPPGVTFSASDLALNGSQPTGCVDVTVEGFDDIATVQFSMNFDPAAVAFSSLQGFNLVGLSLSNFTTAGAANGDIVLGWLDPSTLGVTVADGTTLFQICFTAVSACDTTTFDFSSSPVVIEVTNGANAVVPVSTVSGSIVTDTGNPTITCPANVIVPCNDIYNAGTPVASDNCSGSPSLNFTDDVAICGPVYHTTITRTWTATDAVGNTASCTQTIETLPINLGNFSVPPDITVSGSATSIEPPVTGEPLYNGQPFNGDGCIVAVSKTDQIFYTSCPLFIRIERTWETIDWCIGPPATLIGVQNIFINDNAAPTILNCPANITFYTQTAACNAVVSWVPPTSPLPGVTLSASHTPGSFFPVGTTTVTYTATSPCGNTSTCSFDVQVIDGTAPVAICIFGLAINIPTGCTPVSILGTDVDAGSYDNCGIASLTVSRDNVTYGPNVLFGCSDAGSTVAVTLRVTDTAGNFTECATSITVIASNSTVWYKDSDTDGYSDGTTFTGCCPPSGYRLPGDLIATSGDCDDNRATAYPGAPEICNALDDDCNGYPESFINVWLGLGDGISWTDPDNWSDGVVPLPCQQVVIPSLSNVLIPMGYHAIVKTLHVFLTAQLTVDGTLTVTN